MAGERDSPRVHLLHKHGPVRDIRPENVERGHLHVPDGGARGTGGGAIGPAQERGRSNESNSRNVIVFHSSDLVLVRKADDSTGSRVWYEEDEKPQRLVLVV